mmetsp:Transcript_56179/g.156479  ORF Transcript_56179/g.156479 Transcript_56179/m.156479 type:complete len:81 (-) Transcript_56179:99-341(-)
MGSCLEGLSGGSTCESCPCANGTVYQGSRVQTQWTIDEGGDGRWCPGTVRSVYTNGTVKISYDDGDTWTGDAAYVYLLVG